MTSIKLSLNPFTVRSTEVDSKSQIELSKARLNKTGPDSYRWNPDFTSALVASCIQLAIGRRHLHAIQPCRGLHYSRIIQQSIWDDHKRLHYPWIIQKSILTEYGRPHVPRLHGNVKETKESKQIPAEANPSNRDEVSISAVLNKKLAGQ